MVPVDIVGLKPHYAIRNGSPRLVTVCLLGRGGLSCNQQLVVIYVCMTRGNFSVCVRLGCGEGVEPDVTAGNWETCLKYNLPDHVNQLYQ